RRIHRYSVGRLKRLEACDFSRVRIKFLIHLMILLGKNEENTRMKKAKQCLIALLSGVLLVLLCICTTLYNETLRCCFAVGEKKKYQKIDD
ncbi:hypothetical protein ABHA58_16390, partial [Blautia wexlerae]